MAIMKFKLDIFLAISIICCSVLGSCKRKVSSDKISIQVEVKTDNPTHTGFYYVYKKDAYPITIILSNIQDTVIEIATMTCSWESSFESDNPQLVFIEPHECDSNLPQAIKLNSGESVKYEGFIYVGKNSHGNKVTQFQIGFHDIPYSLFDPMIKIENYKCYWSNIVLLKHSHS